MRMLHTLLRMGNLVRLMAFVDDLDGSKIE